MDDRRTLDLAAVLSRVNGRLINQESLAEPHPRPTSAPPDLLKITKEGLFAYPPAGYENCMEKMSRRRELPLHRVNERFSPQPDVTYLGPVENTTKLRSFENSEKLTLDTPKTRAVTNMLSEAKRQSNELVNRFQLDFLPTSINPRASDKYTTDILEPPPLYVSNHTSVFDASTRSENGNSPTSYDGSMDLLLNSIVSQPQFSRTPSEQSASATHNLPYPLLKHPIYLSNRNPTADTIRYGTTGEDSTRNVRCEQSNFPFENSSKQKSISAREHYRHAESSAIPSVDASAALPPHSVPPMECSGDAHSLSTEERNAYAVHTAEFPSVYSKELMRGFTTHPNGNGKTGAKNCSCSRKISPSNRVTGSLCTLTPEELVTKDCYRGSISAIAKDQAGGRMLQRKLDEGDCKRVMAIYEEVMEDIVELMIDPFGNYLCQKLMEVCSEDQMGAIIDKLSSKLVPIALNTHGTRAVQKMIETLKNSKQKNCVVAALRDSVVVLVKDLNGNHVIQKCLERLCARDCDFIYYAMVANCFEVASHRHGCCVLQRCIDSANHSQRLMLINQICQNAKMLVQDPFGNYVVQYILKDPSVVATVTSKLLGAIPTLSKQKFSSNVVEKCMQVGSATDRKLIVIELLQGGGNMLKDLLLDKYANYVVQRALNVAQEPEVNLLLDGIRPCLEELQHFPAGKIVVAKLVKKYPQLPVHKESCKMFANPVEESVATVKVSNFTAPLDGHSYSEKYNSKVDASSTGNANGVRLSGHPKYPNYPNPSMYGNHGSARRMKHLDTLPHSVMLPEHMSPHSSMTSTMFSPVSDAYVNYLMPPSNYTQMYYRNEYQQISGVFNPMSPYNPAADMHRLLSSPANVGLRNSYNNGTLIPSMTPLDLNAAYSPNATPTGWTNSY
ncbi:Pumilio-family Rna binding repeat-containing protein [Cardiosporidium cionae]|uniref:Pumilio-family Rna binding repeat-containing protein n=1 Tax=Cardiosporidium cionae TaxID=476202 RepID=A0ABQ7JB61_9APIC|nr:Pumilio-family Rna binding repeat-containing protein [Cardiosporidium cionae]|eukprot:KAF8821241.1 Pumilio-family Rna binding repeat-containing protein [Cardiosporidium cionae]